MKSTVLKNMHRIVAVFMLLFGLLALFLSLKDLKFGTFSSPKGGMAPILFSGGIVLFSLPNLLIEWRKPAEIPEKLAGVNWVKWFFFMLICTVYVLLVNKIGFAADTCLGLFAMIKLAGLKGWMKPLLISVIFSGLCWSLFRFAMNVKLPGAGWF